MYTNPFAYINPASPAEPSTFAYVSCYKTPTPETAHRPQPLPPSPPSPLATQSPAPRARTLDPPQLAAPRLSTPQSNQPRVDPENPSLPSGRAPTPAELEVYEALLPTRFKACLQQPHGKSHKNISFTGDVRFRHIIPHIHRHASCMDAPDLANLRMAAPLYCQYERLEAEYAAIDPTPAQGYSLYKDFDNETDLNQQRITLSTAALLRNFCNVEMLVRWLGGPHVGAHRNVQAVLDRLTPGVDLATRAEIERIYTFGAPRHCNAHNTEENLLKFYRYGNHSSVTENEDLFRKVLVKDFKRGNVIILDKRLFPFICNTHLTPQGLMFINDPYKNMRPVFDSTFLPDPMSHGINTWTTKETEPKVTFPGAFGRYLTDLYNFRITYPDLPIYPADDDVTNAFRLVKNNPAVVPMCGYMACDHLCFATGQTFGNNTSPANFEPIAAARLQQADYLWQHKPDEVMRRARRHLQQITLSDGKDDPRPFAPAASDSQNHGKLRPDGSRRAPNYTMMVDDNLYNDIGEFLPRTLAASIASLEDVCPSHPNQAPPLSDEKLNLTYTECRRILGHRIDTRAMQVQLDSRRREKTLKYLKNEGWLTSATREPKTQATIREIAQVIGILDSAGEYFPWAKTRLFALYGILAAAIAQGFRLASRHLGIKKAIAEAEKKMPKDLEARLTHLPQRYKARFLWHRRKSISIPLQARVDITQVYDYIAQGRPWFTPIGHIVPRDPTFICGGDACLHALGVIVPELRIWCVLPFSEALSQRIKKNEVHINCLEFLAITIAYMIVLDAVRENPGQYPPDPIMLYRGDNTSANSWWKKVMTRSAMGQNLLRMYAEMRRLAPVHGKVEHIAGVDNGEADAISRPHELSSPPLTTSLWSISYRTIVQQVCTQMPDKRSWRNFLPNPESLSMMTSMLHSEAQPPPTPPKTFGATVTSSSILSGGFDPKASGLRCSL